VRPPRYVVEKAQGSNRGSLRCAFPALYGDLEQGWGERVHP